MADKYRSKYSISTPSNCDLYMETAETNKNNNFKGANLGDSVASQAIKQNTQLLKINKEYELKERQNQQNANQENQDTKEDEKSESKQEHKEQQLEPITWHRKIKKKQFNKELPEFDINTKPRYSTHCPLSDTDGIFVIFGPKFGFVRYGTPNNVGPIPLNQGFATNLYIGMAQSLNLVFYIMGEIADSVSDERIKCEFDQIFEIRKEMETMVKLAYTLSTTCLSGEINEELLKRQIVRSNSNNNNNNNNNNGNGYVMNEQENKLWNSRAKVVKGFCICYILPCQQNEGIGRSSFDNESNLSGSSGFTGSSRWSGSGFGQISGFGDQAPYGDNYNSNKNNNENNNNVDRRPPIHNYQNDNDNMDMVDEPMGSS